MLLLIRKDLYRKKVGLCFHTKNKYSSARIVIINNNNKTHDQTVITKRKYFYKSSRS